VVGALGAAGGGPGVGRGATVGIGFGGSCASPNTEHIAKTSDPNNTLLITLNILSTAKSLIGFIMGKARGKDKLFLAEVIGYSSPNPEQPYPDDCHLSKIRHTCNKMPRRYAEHPLFLDAVYRREAWPLRRRFRRLKIDWFVSGRSLKKD
jgi:hypothetical protein